MDSIFGFIEGFFNISKYILLWMLFLSGISITIYVVNSLLKKSGKDNSRENEIDLENSKEFYSKIKPDDVSIYQKYFNDILEKVDIDNFTRQSLEKNYDKEKIDKDYTVVEKICNEFKRDNLYPVYLQVMFEQYIHSDPILREKYKKTWINRVMKRESVDFFPDPIFIVHNLFE
jgi:hypothetical protein